MGHGGGMRVGVRGFDKMSRVDGTLAASFRLERLIIWSYPGCRTKPLPSLRKT